MAEQKQDDQHKHTFSNYVRIRDVVQKTCHRWWTIGKSGERGSGISVLPAWHDDDDDIQTMSQNSSVILRTGTVIELRRSQGWRTFEHISCHQSLGTKVWRSKMSQTSLVQAEWSVEFKRNFNIITRELSRVALLFHWWSSNLREPSNWSIKLPYKKIK